MFEPFDIFRIEDGQPMWLSSASALAAAQSHVGKLGTVQPGEYMIFCHRTREKICVRAVEASSAERIGRAA
jgi:hypothetical protein